MLSLKNRQAKFIIKTEKQIINVIVRMSQGRTKKEIFSQPNKKQYLEAGWLFPLTSNHMVIGEPSLGTQNQGKLFLNFTSCLWLHI